MTCGKGYECSPVGGGCGEHFRSETLFAPHLIGTGEREVVCTPGAVMAGESNPWQGVVLDTYGFWTEGDPERIQRAVETLDSYRKGVALADAGANHGS